MDNERRAELRRWARSLAGASDNRDARAAGRAIGLLLDEIERLEGELAEGRREPDRPKRRREPERVQAVAPAPAAPARRSRGRRLTFPRLGRGPGRGTAVVLAAALIIAGAVAMGARALAPELAAAGPRDGSRFGAADVEQLAFSVTGEPGTLRKLRWRIDGEDVTARARLNGGRSTLSGAELPDGEHHIEAVVPGSFMRGETARSWTVSIDRTPPELAVDPKSAKAPAGRPVVLRGRVEPGATLVADGVAAAVQDGVFEVRFPRAPSRPVELVATDAHGNRATAKARIALVPRRPPVPVRSVHVTFHAWAHEGLRRGIMRLVDEGRISAVQLDLKDESGEVGWDAAIPFARKIGSIRKIYDLDEAVKVLHRKGVRVIGRIVAFRDPVHADAAWKRGWRRQVVQTRGGGPYAGYGGFTNFADATVRQYNIDVAIKAAEAGVDEILYDYVRRPDGPTRSMRFPGLKGTPETSIASFLADARRQLEPYDVFLGASVFGVAATRPKEVAQPIRAMARHADYIAPMLYPSHWAPGEYDVRNPNAQPYDIIFRSLEDFQKQTKGTGARVVPWLQDFSLGVSYGPAEVRAQIRAAAARGINEWILWDPLVTYTAEALDRHPRRPPIKKAKPKPQPPAQPAPATPASTTAAPPPAKDAAAARRVRANELGVVPVIMYHQIRADGGGDYDLTPAQFRAELRRLHREGYVPIRAADLVKGRIDVPAGKSPVVLTFDDSTKEQLAWDARKRPRPDTAIAIMLDVARKNPGFRPAGTFYVNKEPFAGVAEGPEMLRWLHENGFELGNHTDDHIPFAGRTPAQVQQALVRGKQIIVDAVPDAPVETMALPLGVMPTPPSLARAGTWRGISYRHEGVFLVGAEPAPSPFASAFRPMAVPRMRTSPPGARDGSFGSTYWLDELKRNPGRRYVSDGDPQTISFPKRLSAQLAQRFRARANAY